ncbi:MAG: DUF1844 domain-containing protein [Candidatus Omnitrophica bacterium]|nr:DUF1844 domain-containing protein [Candidatus Omnitrophota bacterium]
MDEKDKKIDESWKAQVEKEKTELKNTNDDFTPITPDFSFFITTLSLQASISLGIVPNPATNKTEKSLNQAKFIIDTLDMLKEKTNNNLTKEESTLIENMLYELKMQYIATSKGETK